MTKEKIYYGILNQNIHKQNEIEFSKVKTYPEINGLRYAVIRIDGNDLFLIRSPCQGEFRRAFKYSTIIDIKNEFYILITKVQNIKAADTKVRKLQDFEFNKAGEQNG